ncbi:transporter [Rubrivivax gelatinosus]|uniref:Nicotinamide riboside transporter PnuC n=1 Tax=Rubrivivax gelatinosus TaxID=28068 RepID=A0ABS1DN84_RUBGE|nr:transporter [Rubrivivax gelatinosus]MBK1711444.1 transporter [Rubrivivax gelatinosus]
MLDAVLEPAQPLLRVAFTLLGSPVTWLELVAFALGVWMVLCNLRVNPLAWPLAIASSLLYALLFADSRLYGEAALQIFFIAVAFWGWWQWLRGRGEDGRALAVHRLAPAARWRALAATALAWPALALLLDHATDSDVPWMDALPTVGSIAGQFLLGRKLVENWPVWVAVNLVSIVLFGLKGLWLTVLLYAVFAVMAAFGWRAWLRLVDEGHGR